MNQPHMTLKVEEALDKSEAFEESFLSQKNAYTVEYETEISMIEGQENDLKYDSVLFLEKIDYLANSFLESNPEQEQSGDISLILKPLEADGNIYFADTDSSYSMSNTGQIEKQCQP